MIRVLSDVVKHVGSSRDLIENQQRFRVISAAWRIHSHQYDVTYDEKNDSKTLMETVVNLLHMTLRDRQHLVHNLSDNPMRLLREDVPLPQRILNLRMTIQLLDQWTARDDTHSGGMCQHKSEAIARLS